MPDARFIRSRVGVRVYHYPGEVISWLKEPEMLASMTSDELRELKDFVITEINYRENGEKNV